jgi:hypothetical protein
MTVRLHHHDQHAANSLADDAWDEPDDDDVASPHEMELRRAERAATEELHARQRADGHSHTD